MKKLSKNGKFWQIYKQFDQIVKPFRITLKMCFDFRVIINTDWQISMQKLWKSGIFWHDLNPKVFMLEIHLKWKVRLLHLHSNFIEERECCQFSSKTGTFSKRRRNSYEFSTCADPFTAWLYRFFSITLHTGKS